jgi:acetyl-CoA/propionyl-CoA carboxylase biotin carboxyl carrier protein
MFKKLLIANRGEIAVRVGVHADRAHAQVATRARDADRYLSPVGYQQLLEHRQSATVAPLSGAPVCPPLVRAVLRRDLLFKRLVEPLAFQLREPPVAPQLQARRAPRAELDLDVGPSAIVDYETILIKQGAIHYHVVRAVERVRMLLASVVDVVGHRTAAMRLAPAIRLIFPQASHVAPVSRAPAESYLDIPKLLDAARRSGAEALHPGYGFLAESPALAEACGAAGVRFVGPSPEAIRLMGDKAVSRRLAREAGVPLTPGTEPVAGPDEAQAFAREHGYPVAIKAVAGGGGRGMRVVREDAELEASLDGARREGELYFGNPEVYLERYLEDPKHIEIQVMGLCSGEALALGERDCSVQRRHQKLIEEAPGPTVSPELRTQMEGAAVRLAERVGYRGAGTVEFMLARDGGYYFLEMNTRIQVEHPVTELVRRCDLVAMQLLVAAGEGVDAPGPIEGHAFECRINAESVAGGFRPSPGTLSRLVEPSGPGVRVDAGTLEGYTIPSEYDSMIAKLIVWGADREQARRRTLRALREYRVEGVPTTLPAHEWILQHPEFVSGGAGTAFLERELPALLAALPPEDVPAPSPANEGGAPREAVVEVNGRRFQVAVYGLGAPQTTGARPVKPRLAGQAATGRGGGDTLPSPIQGNVLRISVEEGQPVSKGDLVCVIEAMKMENEIAAHKDGVVRKLHVSPGQAVATGAPLAEIAE